MLVAGFDPSWELMPPALAAAVPGVLPPPGGPGQGPSAGVGPGGAPLRPDAAGPAAGRTHGRTAVSDALWDAAAAVAEWGEGYIEACAPYVVAVKFQMASFERLQAPGWAALARLVQACRSSGLLAIADGKRGDIELSTRAYGAALFGPVELPGGLRTGGLDVDAATVHPYLGDDTLRALQPWLAGAGRGIFVLVHTSNLSAARLQHLPLADGRQLADAVADAVAEWNRGLVGESGYGPVGAVVGATYPAEAARLRRRMPQAWLLVPGLGVQGGRAEALGPLFDREGLGAVVAASRSLMGAWAGRTAPDWKQASADAARTLRESLERVRAAGE